MAERTVELKFKVSDDGSLKLQAIGGNIGKVTNEISKMDKALSIIKWDSIINLGERAYRTGKQIYDMTKNVAAFGDEIMRSARTLGMTTREYQEFGYMAMRSDVSTQSLTIGLRNLTKTMDEVARGVGEGADIFKVLGMSVYDSEGKMKSLRTMMEEFGAKFSGWKEGPEKIAIALKIFGKAGEEIIPYLNQGSSALEKYRKEFERLGIEINTETLEALAKADEAFERFGKKFEILKTKTLVPVVLEVEKFIEKILKLIELAERIGKGENIPEAISKTIGNREAWLKARMTLGMLRPEEFEELMKLQTKTVGILPEKKLTTAPTITADKSLDAFKKAREDIIEQNYKMSNFYQFEENMMKGRLRMLDSEKTKREEILKLQDRLNDLNKSALDIMDKLGIGTKAATKSWIGEMTKEYETLLGTGLFTGEELGQAKEKYTDVFKYMIESGDWKDMIIELDEATKKFEKMTAQDTEAAKLKTEIKKLEDEVSKLNAIVKEPMKLEFDISSAKGQLSDLWTDFETIRERMLEPISVVFNITGTGSSEMPIMEKIEEIYGGFEGMSDYISNLKFQMNLSSINEQIKKYQDIITESMGYQPGWRAGSYEKYMRSVYQPKITALEVEKSYLTEAQAYAKAGGGGGGYGVSINVNTMNVYGTTSEEMVADMDEALAELWNKDRSKLKTAVS